MATNNSSGQQPDGRPPWVPPPLPPRRPAAKPTAKPVRHPADATGFPGFLGIFLALVACVVILWPFLIWHGTAVGIVEGVWLVILAPLAVGAVASHSVKKRGN